MSWGGKGIHSHGGYLWIHPSKAGPGLRHVRKVLTSISYAVTSFVQILTNPKWPTRVSHVRIPKQPPEGIFGGPTLPQSRFGTSCLLHMVFRHGGPERWLVPNLVPAKLLIDPV